MMILRLSFLFIFFPSLIFAQLPNEAFYDSDSIHVSDTGRWSVNLRSMGFTKNNEYFNGIADGYTLFGTQLNPRLLYTVNSVFQIETGVFVRDDFGNPGLQQITPTVTFRAKHLGAEVLLGTLDGSLNHRLIEPLYDFERALVDRIENGVQFRVDKPGIFADLWVEWETMIYPGDSLQEEMYGGFSFEKRLGSSSWYLPLQVLIYHQGGQIDSNPAPLKTWGNFAVGLKRNDLISDKISIENSVYYLYYQDFSRDPIQVYLDGAGLYANSMVRLPHGIQIMLSYWRGAEFIGLQGGKRYPSVSSRFKNPDYLEPLRRLLILRLMQDVRLGDQLFLTTRIEPFYDFNTRKIEFNNSLYLQYRVNWKLPKRN